MAEPELRVSVVDAPTQEVSIKIRGECTLSFAESGDAEGVPDPVASFVAAAQLHMLNRSQQSM